MGLFIKTDNGPAYTGNSFISFCKEFGIEYKTGIPYNPMGQEVVEHAHRTLKNVFLKQRMGNYTLLDHPNHTLILFYSF